jgi:hypothetical protein
MKMSNSPSAVVMSLWITAACASCSALSWFGLALEDVVARELVLGALQLVGVTGSASARRTRRSAPARAPRRLPGCTIATA